ncbi:MAG: 3-keto-disaccharide hydrolase [Thermoguttaceae bacterium]|jgi:hypothetical protein
MSISRRVFLGRAGATVATMLAMPRVVKAEPIRLFNGKNLDGWYCYTSQAKYENPGIFTVVDGMLRVAGGSGETAYYGGLITKQSFSNYKLSFDYKWGEPTYGSRKDKARDSGVLLHCVGPNEPGPWMTSYEFQVIEGGTGDLLVVPANGSVDDAGKPVVLQLSAEIVREGKATIWREGGETTVLRGGRVNWYGRDPEWRDTVGFRGREDVESKFGEWTHCEAICKGDTLEYRVNGKLVNKAFGLSITRGKLLFQTEGAEVWYRDILLTPLAG